MRLSYTWSAHLISRRECRSSLLVYAAYNYQHMLPVWPDTRITLIMIQSGDVVIVYRIITRGGVDELDHVNLLAIDSCGVRSSRCTTG